MNRLLLLLLMLVVGCSAQDSRKNTSFVENEVKEAVLLIPTEPSHKVGAPSEMNAVSGGILVYDYGLEELFKLNADGNALLSFGRRGRGPGEFQNVFGLWEFDDGYWVYDYSSAKFVTYDREGKWIKDLPVEFEEFPRSPTRVEMINSQQFVIASDGKDGSLLTLVDIETQNTQNFGEAVGKYVRHDPEEARQAISMGRVPADAQNEVMLSSNQTGIFSFQQATAILEKYAHTGELMWRKNVKMPPVADLFDHLFQENRRRINQGKFLLSFNYARRMSANKDGVAILLNTLEDQPLTVAWIPNNGQQGTVLTFPGIENRLLGLTFTISTDGSYIFVVDALDGELYRAKWPL